MPLAKRVAASGRYSRREAQKLIEAGRVTVNGKTVLVPGGPVAVSDDVRLDGNPLLAQPFRYVVLNKPAGYVSTLRDPQGRRTVVSLLPDVGVKLKPAGRLDFDTEGLLLFTNDGELAFRLTHPRFGVEKEYEVVVRGLLTEESRRKLTRGVTLEDGRSAPARILRVEADPRRQRSSFRLVIHQGRKRLIRRMCEAVGHPVLALKRVRIGRVVLRRLPTGCCRILGKAEVGALRRAVGLD